MPIYKDDRNVITPLFDQIRRITETEDAMTFEGATESLLNITPGGAFPVAEESVFGVESSSMAYGLSSATVENRWINNNITAGWRFTAAEAFSVLGLRYYDPSGFGGYRKWLTLWNSSGEVVKEIILTSAGSDGWYTEYFDSPFNIAKGETYTVSIYTNSSSVGNRSTSSATWNSKLTSVKKVYSNTSTSKTFPESSYSYTAMVDIVIGAVATELPDDYQVQRTTLDDIAVEVQRISGTTSKMTPAQMLTALQAIATE